MRQFITKHYFTMQSKMSLIWIGTIEYAECSCQYSLSQLKGHISTEFTQGIMGFSKKKIYASSAGAIKDVHTKRLGGTT